MPVEINQSFGCEVRSSNMMGMGIVNNRISKPTTCCVCPPTQPECGAPHSLLINNEIRLTCYSCMNRIRPRFMMLIQELTSDGRSGNFLMFQPAPELA
jgi:hypothetical protein